MRVNLFRGTVANIVSGALTIGVIAFSANLHAQDSLSANVAAVVLVAWAVWMAWQERAVSSARSPR
jgi:hypothetical protein